MKVIKLFIFLGVISILASCGFLYGSPETKSDAIRDISELSWEVTPFEFINQDNQAFGSNDLKGQYWIANMIFTSCPTVCQTMTPNMTLLQEEANEIDVQFVSFTVDPDFDDPKGLKKYGEAYGADFENYHFLTGYSIEEITDFAETSFKSIVLEIPDANDIMHSVNFYLVDGDGKVIRIYDGNTDFDEKAIIKDLKNIID
ncbi:SCO family protein [Bacillaceae bacterium IKA-2]|jgi:protein SCO1/2|nr:SCO family protein [Bacillaceae bacterium IKA-2]